AVRWSAESWLDVPVRTRLALAGTWPNPVTSELRVSFSLAGLGAAKLELLDVAGRTVKAWPLSGARAGAHVRTLERDGALAPGVYLLRLTEGRASGARRVTLGRCGADEVAVTGPAAGRAARVRTHAPAPRGRCCARKPLAHSTPLTGSRPVAASILHRQGAGGSSCVDRNHSVFCSV
ncbi:MAG: T9SS type A sorting domain-containing protein, partial [Candidatus Eisenbacteria bacterium]|nr:T9SS type A sorting domain-containing protein [Candidatus Eisenbacteria bacterium]